MVFYIDLIILLNFVIDYLILLTTSKFLSLNHKKTRMGLAAAIGALYTLIYFVPSLNIYKLFFTKILLSVMIVFISFGFVNLVRFVRIIAVFYLISFLTGGGVFALQYLFNIDHDIINGIYVSRSSSPMMILIFIFLAFIGILLFSNNTFKSIKRKTNVQEKIIDFEIIIGGFSFTGRGLIDTGNQLYDPITRKPVMIIEANELHFIPAVIKEAYRNGQFQLELFEEVSEKLDDNWLSIIQLVPFRSVSREMQFILTIRPDKVVIKTDGKQEINQTRVLIGLDYGHLSNDRTYQAIIHPELVAG